MLKKGEIGARWEGIDKPEDKHWYEEIRWSDLDIPFCVRPKGKGERYNFYSFSNLQDKSMEIREAAPWKFRHTGDVHRNAHYIGMYILDQIYIKDKNNLVEEAVAKMMEDKLKITRKREYYRNAFRNYFEKFVLGLATEDDVHRAMEDLLEKIDDPELKEWFIKDCDTFMTNEGNYTRIKNKYRMKEARAKGISLVEE